MKHFIITIDTEGDNLWTWKEGMPITTKNTEFLPRFQRLCEAYGFKPTWLVNWEMLRDRKFVDFAEKSLQKGTCEIGMHLHAWNTPPYYKLPWSRNSGQPFLTEYPPEIMEEKIASITQEFQSVFGYIPHTHRAGRWAINKEYLDILRRYGYRIDCSVTPYVDWSSTPGQTEGSRGPDFSKERPVVSKKRGLLEIPVSTMLSGRRFTKESREQKKLHAERYPMRVFWLRPQDNNLKSMQYLIRSRASSKMDYLEFMIHSSELMPGGSPNFPSEEDIEKLYRHLEIIFKQISKDYVGFGLEEYGMLIERKGENG